MQYAARSALRRRGRQCALKIPWILVLAACTSVAPTAEAPAPASDVVRLTPDPDLAALEKSIRDRVAREDSVQVSVAMVDLGTGLRLEIDADIAMHAASTMKVPVMLEVFRQAEAGRLSLDEPLAVTNEFTSLVGDSVYVLTAESDSDSTLYARIGSTVPIRELVRLMIVRSSNLALNLLMGRVGAPNVRKTMAEIGAAEMIVRRGVQDLPAFNAGLNNTTTARGFANALEAIARCSVTLRTACNEMTDVLAAQEFNDMIPAGLPAHTRVAHKTGWITRIRHDGGIIFPATRAPYVLVILTRGFDDAAQADALGADISRMVWEQLGPGTIP